MKNAKLIFGVSHEFFKLLHSQNFAQCTWKLKDGLIDCNLVQLSTKSPQDIQR